MNNDVRIYLAAVTNTILNVHDRFSFAVPSEQRERIDGYIERAFCQQSPKLRIPIREYLGDATTGELLELCSDEGAFMKFVRQHA